MLMTAEVREPVNLMVSGGKPARFYWDERWTVTEATATQFEYLGSSTIVTGWQATAQTEDGCDVATFVLVRDYAGFGWLIERVTYA